MQDHFQQSTSNWLNFQNIPPDATFQTEYKYIEDHSGTTSSKPKNRKDSQF